MPCDCHLQHLGCLSAKSIRQSKIEGSKVLKKGPVHLHGRMMRR